jgi:hypothetical protein
MVKGKTTKIKASHVPVELQDEAIQKQFIILSVDLMHFMGTVFLVTVL